MSRRKFESVDECRQAVEQALAQNGQFTHNIISITLKICADKFGSDAANSLIDECELEDLGWSKVE